MKEVWRCQWETIPGNGEQVEVFPTLAAAKQAMRQKISQCVDLREYLPDLDPEAAKYLGSFLSDPEFPRSEEDVPEDYDEPEHGELSLDSDCIFWEYPCDAYPYLRTDLVTTKQSGDSYEFEFRYNYPEDYNGNGVTELSIKIELKTDYGTSAYPLMVLFALREEPATQEQIACRIRETWETVIDRKAIGRHLELLKALGYPVQHGAEGYYYSGDILVPSADVKWTPGAYPLMVLEVLDVEPQTQNEIVQAVQEKYGIKVDRKAVGRHLALLKALGFDILQKCKSGYYLDPKE